VNPVQTSLSLLDRLQRPADEDAWVRFHSLYCPLIRRWIDRAAGFSDEADDVAQEVLLVVLRELPGFVRQRDGSFRTWLRQITANRLRTFWRQRAGRLIVGQPDATAAFLDQLEDPNGNLTKEWDRDHDRHVFNHLLTIVQTDFTTESWLAFRRFAIDGLSAGAVATELGLTTNAVLLAKSRVLKRLREEAGDLIE
jgi:RNA polymerase sigma-70 factor, ECF subfamily